MSLRKLKNSRTGVVVRVDERTATRLGAEWALVEGAAIVESVPVEESTVVETTEESEEVKTGVDPARPSNGASRKEWATYVASLGLEPGKLTRGELIDLVDNGVPDESDN